MNRLSGGRSRWSGLVTGFSVLLFLPFAGVLAPLPTAVLAGIVIAAISTLFRPRELLRMWSLSRPQAFVGWGTFAFTLLLAPHIEQAVLLGVVMATAVHMWPELRPGLAARRDGDTLHLEPSGILWFGSAPAMEDALFARLADEPDVKRVVLDCSGLGRIDLTGAYSLAEMLEQVRRAGLEMEIESVPERTRRMIEAAGVGTHQPPAS